MSELKQKATEILTFLLDTATQTKDFIVEQIPQVLQELIAYHTALYIFWMVIGLGLAVVGFCIFRAVTKAYSEEDRDGKIVYDPGYPGEGIRWWACLPWGLSLLVFITSTIGLLKITLAPRVWLLEYAAYLVRGN